MQEESDTNFNSLGESVKSHENIFISKTLGTMNKFDWIIIAKYVND